MAELYQISEKYLAEKSIYYTSQFYELFKDYKPNKLLEIGIGNYNAMKWYRGDNYQKGPSLRMWRDYFEECEIYGCDINEDSIFQEERIKTMIVNQSSIESLQNMIETFGRMDIIIDDGSVSPPENLNSIRTLWKYVNDYYIIQDVLTNHYDTFENILKDELEDCEEITRYNAPGFYKGLMVFKKKSV